ncbi:MAG: branched-chain amino acid aminotransferase [Actinobacteria bacterium]|nr:branched-chain amino acid aminotransferase [Actinomycetota bacterium]
MSTTETATAPVTSAEPFQVRPSSSPASDAARDEVLSAPRFGAAFTDHMVRIDWSAEAGWHDARVTELQPLSLHPGAAVLHYAQEIFEGLKVYRHPDGALRAFRPDMNAARFRRSATRLALPELPDALFLESIEQLIDLDATWVPSGAGQSLYLRPFLIATEPFLGVRPSTEASYLLIASPSGSYFDDPDAGVRLWLSTTYSRAGRGGTGAAKCGGNYASSLLAQMEARAHECQQVLFTDAATNTLVEEAGSMNIFFIIDETVITPPTDGTILEGVTRDSVLQLAAELGYRTETRPVSITEWAAAAENGSLSEVFAAGTAAVITPISEVIGDDLTISTPTKGMGPLAAELHAELTGIQFGQRADRFGWMHRLRAR